MGDNLAMSLVDYAASSDEDEPPNPEDPEQRPRFGGTEPGQSSAASSKDDPVYSRQRMSMNSDTPSRKQAEIAPDQSSDVKLPDASFLLNSPVVPSNTLNALDHSSLVAAAKAESAARKRDFSESPASYPRRKVAKGVLPHSKSVPETVGGRLLPPQLAGRSNVVTEDLSRLFVRKQADSSTTSE